MDDVLKLGDFIELKGFENIDRGSMVVVKKMVGNYVKECSEKIEDFEKFSVVLEQNDQNDYRMQATLKANGRDYTAESSGKNLFITMDQVLKSINPTA